jgi:hypothetical protein
MNDAIAQRYDDRYFTVGDGLKLHYRDYPGSADRPPILCLPGLTRTQRISPISPSAMRRVSG